MIVRLSPFEVLHAAQAGIARTVSALRDLRYLGDGRVDLGFERDVLGAIAEYAVARELDRCWRPAVGRLDTYDGDVAGVQVRATARPDGCLIVRPPDPDDHAYVLALIGRGTTNGLDVELVGWIWGADAKVAAHWRAPNGRPGAYFVPPAGLRDLTDLAEQTRRGRAMQPQTTTLDELF